MNHKWISAGLLVGLAIAGWACGDDSAHDAGAGSGGHSSDHSSSTTGASSSSTAAGGAGGGGGDASAQAPIMESASPLEGALHVTWENVTPDCDMIELDRKKDDGAYAVAYTLTGAADSQHDSSAIPPGTYCYKARCKKGSMTSPDSNEKCGTP